jgi:hypothetical protein
MGLRRKVEFKNHEPQFPAPLEGYAATVELPEGHHVTIGELTPGTIVEVATWNGTGKPDESTKRFLISADGTGLSRRVVQEPSQVSESVKPEITNQIYVPSAISSSQPISDPIYGFAPAENIVQQKSIERESDNSPLIEKSLATAKFVGLSVLIFAIIFSGLKFAGIGATVPTVGSKSFFGSSTNSIVFYKKTSDVKAGTPVIAKDNNAIVFGNYGGDIGNLSLFTINDAQFSVPKETLAGRGILLIPYIGSVLKPIIN